MIKQITRFVPHHPNDNMYNMNYLKREFATLKEMEKEAGVSSDKIHMLKTPCGVEGNSITLTYSDD